MKGLSGLRQRLATWLLPLLKGIYVFKGKHPLALFIISRTISMVIILLILGLAVFGLMSLSPGDIVDNYVRSQMLMQAEFRQPDNAYTEDAIDAAKDRLGLNVPFYVQHGRWLTRVIVDQDLGRTLISPARLLFRTRDRTVNSLVL